MALQIIVDNVGRTIVGELVELSEHELKLHNPAVINFISDGKEIKMQIIPLFFRELVNPSEQDKGTTWSYTRCSTTIADPIELNDDIKNRYNGIFNPSPIITPISEIPAAKLF